MLTGRRLAMPRRAVALCREVTLSVGRERLPQGRRPQSVGAFELWRSLLLGRLTGLSLLQEADNVLHRRSRGEHLCDAELLELRDVAVGDRSSDGDEDVARALLAQELDDARHERHVGPGQDRD